MAFKIFYNDHYEYDSESDDNMPGRGVQAIVQDHSEIGAEIITACDYYVRENDGRWRGVDIFGLFDFLLDSGIVVFGRTIDKDQYAAIVYKAMSAKNGWLPREVRPNG